MTHNLEMNVENPYRSPSGEYNGMSAVQKFCLGGMAFGAAITFASVEAMGRDIYLNYFVQESSQGADWANLIPLSIGASLFFASKFLQHSQQRN